MEDDDLRVEPLGNDRAGNLYYFFPQFYEERRLYRLDPETQQWALWAKGDDAFRTMLKSMKGIRGRKIRGEQELLDHLEVIVEQIDDEDEARARQLEKANRLAILEAIPRKRSLRLQVKQLEKMEKHQEELEHQKELSAEEIAEMKRAELLQKVEREAEKEARDAEREARRLHREQVDREEAHAERERRRLRRIDKEKEEEKLEQLVEEERRKQEEARELRARQRHAVEVEQKDQSDVEDAATTAALEDSATVRP
ncbi:Exosome complex uclease RRP6-like protein [Phytophthora palmivora]|uniref:Exosome complex uclease RRP6-like protein n=1 Tax=Phytophthora palmivora TaxID=4796 RepID=A0A2P4XKF5_9STRA|nr:Exosome complex uclease RRP6-like protein [Phytophthora palmivora]